MPSVQDRLDTEDGAESLLTSAVPLPSRNASSKMQDRSAKANAPMIASLSFGVTLLGILGIGLWNRGSFRRIEDNDVESFYKFKFGQVQDMLHWKSGVMHLCKFSEETDPLEVVKLPAARTQPRGNICHSHEMSRSNPCAWTKKWHCPAWQAAGHDSEDDGGIAYHCCCLEKRPRSKTFLPHPFVNENFPAPSPMKARIKVVSYNLEWWRVYGKLKGNGGTEGGVLATTHVAEPIDLIAFQECGDKDRVLQDAGLLPQFVTFGAPYQKCTAVRKDAWRWLGKGHEDVAADVYWNNFGFRGVMWQRLWHKSSGLRVFFANFHGPLAINSGGCCGGKRSARNLLRVIQKHSQPGDVIILLGDFNANSASQMVKELRKSLVHVQSGKILGGIDHCFVNLPGSTVVAMQDLGSGGSDHHAVATVFEIDTAGQNDWTELEQNSQLSASIIGELHADFPKDDWGGFWCGLEEIEASYNPVGQHGWVVDWVKVPTTDWCCRHCQRQKDCKAFRFEGISGSNHTRCTLMSQYEKGVANSSYLTVASGLPASVAIQELQNSFANSKVYLNS